MTEDNAQTDSGGGGEDRFEARLNQITSAVETLARSQREITEGQRALSQATEQQQIEGRILAYGQQLTRALSDAEGSVETMQARLASAHEDGDSAVIARAHRELSEAIAARETASRKLEEHKSARETWTRQKQQRQEQAKKPANNQQTEREAPDFTNLNDWKNRNSSWYGVDTNMTKAAHEIDRQIREAGVIAVGSKPYFEAIDRQMARRYPDRFSTSPETAGGSSRGQAQGGGSRQGRIPQSVVDGWRRMGINVDDPTVVDRMIKHRETAVRKGLLPETPIYDRVRT